MRHRTAAQRRSHHAKQRARKARYRAWEVENAAILIGLGFTTREHRKIVYSMRHCVRPTLWGCYDPAMLQDLIQVEALARDAFVSTASAAALPKLAELVGTPKEDA